MDGDSAFWSMTVNNYDETDLALVQQGYPDYIRQIVYTLERGEKTGTPHIQAYIRLFRGQRMSYVKKLFPRGSFRQLKSDEYRLNTQRYAQKLDQTAESPAVINNNPFPDPVVELTDVIETLVEASIVDLSSRDKDVMYHIAVEERERVSRKPSLAKFYVSATYKNIKKEFFRSLIVYCLDKRANTHTHTHVPEKFSGAEDITDASSSVSQDSETEEGEGEQDGSSCEDDGSSESGSSCSSQEDD